MQLKVICDEMKKKCDGEQQQRNTKTNKIVEIEHPNDEMTMESKPQISR